MRSVVLIDKNKVAYNENFVVTTEASLDGQWWKVLYVGICKTDTHIASCPQKKGMVLGHEVVAMAMTQDEKKYYALNNEISCGHCSYCLEGNTSHCQFLTELGVNAHGGYAEKIFAPRHSMYEITFKKLKLGVLVEPLACAFHCAKKIAQTLTLCGKKIKIPNILVIGAGVSGRLVTYALKKNKVAANYDVFDVNSKSTSWCEGLGVQSVASLKNNHYHVIVECSGSTDGLLNAYDIVRNSGFICIYGVPARGGVLFDCLDIFKKELTIIASMAGCNSDSMSAAISCIAEDEIFFENMLGKRVALEQVPKEILCGQPVPGTRTFVDVDVCSEST